MSQPHPLRYRLHNEVSLFTLLIAFFYMLTARDVFLILGFPLPIVLALLVLSYIGSGINLPLFSVESTFRRDVLIPIRFFGYGFSIPQFVSQKTFIALNVGGALIPLLISVLLLTKDVSLLPHLLLPLLVSSLLINRQARLVPGMGVTLPALYAPAVAIASSFLFLLLTQGVEHIVGVVYITATLGSLIGADLMNLKKIPSLGSPLVSIGGAGTFDGVFMSGILAIALIGTLLPVLV